MATSPISRQGTVKVTVSHNQTIGGVDFAAGDTTDIDVRLARVLAARGAIQFKDEDVAAAVRDAAAAPAPAAADTDKKGAK